MRGPAQLGGATVAVTGAGEKRVRFRSASGPAALLDRCQRRGVARSSGRVRKGCLECPSFGWRFDGEGAARSVVKEQVIATHGSRLRENVLDAPHLPFVHRWPLDGAARAPADDGARDRDGGHRDRVRGRIRGSLDGETTGPTQGAIRHDAPNLMKPGMRMDDAAARAALVANVQATARTARLYSRTRREEVTWRWDRRRWARPSSPT